MSQKREQWGSKIGFVLAAMGSAVGLGGIWKFPYMAGSNGGGIFLLTYLLCVAFVAFPLMSAEMTIGRVSGQNCFSAFSALRGPKWSFLGVLCGLCPLLILSYYVIIGGWTVKYFFASFSSLMPAVAQGNVKGFYETFVASPGALYLFTLAFILLTAVVVYKGIGGGIERACKVMMPALFLLLVVLVVRAVTLSGGAKGLSFFLKPHWKDLSADTVLIALGQAFFTMSLGMGAMVTYGSYIPREVNVPKAAAQVCISTAFVSILAGMAIFPAATAFGVEVNSGPSLAFVTLPAIFSQMPGAVFWAAAFFLLMFFAALTSSISLFEVGVSWMTDHKMKRSTATIIVLLFLCALSAPSVLALAGQSSVDWFDLFVRLTDYLWVPGNGLLVCLFAGWVAKKQLVAELPAAGGGAVLWFCIRLLAPVAILAVLVSSFIK